MLCAGLYGRDGVLPARRTLRFTGRALREQLRDAPTLLWLGPRLGLDTEQGMELLCLLGVLASFGALVCDRLRDALVFLLLWALYLSLYQVRAPRPAPRPHASVRLARCFTHAHTFIASHVGTHPCTWFGIHIRTPGSNTRTCAVLAYLKLVHTRGSSLARAQL